MKLLAVNLLISVILGSTFAHPVAQASQVTTTWTCYKGAAPTGDRLVATKRKTRVSVDVDSRTQFGSTTLHARRLIKVKKFGGKKPEGWTCKSSSR